MLYNRKDILISVHIPKCGGTSFNQVLRKWFGLGFHFHRFNPLKMQFEPCPKWKLFLNRIKPVVIHGHFGQYGEFSDGNDVFRFYPAARQFITVLRDPLEAQISFYNYKRKMFAEGNLLWNGKKVEDISKHGKDIDEHIGRGYYYKMFGSLPFDLNLKNYKDILRKNFIHVGITENLPRTVAILAEKLEMEPVQIPSLNTTGEKEYPSESAIKKFREIHQLEYALYEYAQELNS